MVGRGEGWVGGGDESRACLSIAMFVWPGGTHARGSAARQPDWTGALRVAIATLWDGGPKYRCALPLWCRSARMLGQAVNASLATLIISPTSAWDGCDGAARVWSTELVDAVEKYVSLRRGGIQLIKLLIFSRTEYDVVVFTDLDIDPHSRWKGLHHGVPQWIPSLTAFVASRACLAGWPDVQSPINGGLLVAKPRRWLYSALLALLRGNLTFDPDHGFGHTGLEPPGRPRALSVDVDLIAQGSGESTSATNVTAPMGT